MDMGNFSSMTSKAQSWNQSNLATQAPASGIIRHHPSELMLRSLFSRAYAAHPPIIKPETRVLDIGTMYVNNLVPFYDRGCRCHGIEINEEMVGIAKSYAKHQGIGATITVGSNRNIGYPDESFDILLSINTIHYEDDVAGLRDALKEYHRVLGKDGRAFIVTTGPLHHIREHARCIAPNRYEITADDFRRGQVMAYFEDQVNLAALVAEVFTTVETGRQIENHPNATLDYFYALAVK
jgi:SAM-dependent methyltransferase